jgi:tRNA pseudouridine55 synthase
MNGLLVVNKPTGPTSHDVVYKIRKWSGERRAGHTGTLDPLASGVLVVCLGIATRISEYLIGGDKQYRALIRFGQTTDTYDTEGEVINQHPVELTLSDIEAALEGFRGPIRQIPPAFSAVQINGRRAYDLARKGQRPDLTPRTVTIHALSICDWRPPDLTLDVTCSAGTYIRSLAHDLGERLGCGGHLAGLTRTAASGFTLAEAHTLDHIQAAFKAGHGAELIRPADCALSHWPEVRLDAASADRLQHGHPAPFVVTGVMTTSAVPLAAEAATTNLLLGRAYDPRGNFIAIVEADSATQQWKPKKVLIHA